MDDKLLRDAITDYLNNPHTHASLTDAAKSLPEKYINERPAGLQYSFWDMLEHIRICQWDMLEFIRNSSYNEMSWPADYWPDKDTKATAAMWKQSVADFERDYNELRDLVNDKSFDILNKVPHGSGQTVFREILQIVDHNSYHIGQLIMMRKLVGQWG